MADYRNHYEAIRAAGADLAVLSVDTPAQSDALRRALGLPFPMLSDVDRRVVKEWGVYNARERGGIAKPAVFVIGSDRRVRYTEVDGVTTRAPASEIVRLLQDSPTPSAVRRRVYLPRLPDWVRAFGNSFRS